MPSPKHKYLKKLAILLFNELKLETKVGDVDVTCYMSHEDIVTDDPYF